MRFCLAAPLEPAEEIRTRVEGLRGRISAYSSEAKALLKQSLDDPTEAGAHYHSYLKLSQLLFLFEQFDMPMILRFSDADRDISSMCRAFLAQVGWPLAPPPNVSAFSSDYYWIFPPSAIIWAPANEHERLLAVGDLAHELGHLAFAKKEAYLVRDTLVRVRAHVKRSASSPPASLGAPPNEFFSDMMISWREWIQEFVCDAFACYLTGPAYAWQHLRLCCIREAPAAVYEIPERDEHPADAARMALALCALGELGLDGEAAEIDEHWTSALQASGATPDPEYQLIYPDELLRATVENVFAGCAELGLRAYDPAIPEECDVPRLVNEAWRALLSEPETYERWEREALSRCRPVWAQA